MFSVGTAAGWGRGYEKKPVRMLGMRCGQALYGMILHELQSLGFTEREVDTETYVHVGVVHGDELRGHLEELVVGSQEKVEASRVEIEHPAERRTE